MNPARVDEYYIKPNVHENIIKIINKGILFFDEDFFNLKDDTLGYLAQPRMLDSPEGWTE